MRISHCLSCLSALTLATASLAPARADWTFNTFPLANLDVYDLAAREDTLLLFSSLTRGLYRSRDDGKTWDLLDTVMGDFYGLEADGKEIFIFGGEGVLRSRDNGNTWQPANQGMAAGAEISALFPLGPILYTATSEGTFRSADRGDSWIRVHRGADPEFSSMTSVEGVLFASGLTLNRDSSLYRSTDNGLSWKLAGVPALDLGWVTGVTGHGGYLYVTSDFAGLLRARPDGSEWKSLQVGDGSRVSRTWSDGATLYAYTKGGLFQSSDSGMTWMPQGQPGSRGEAFLRSVSGSRLFEQTKDYDVNESRDNGANWTRLAIPKRQADQLGNLFSSGPNLIAYRRGGKSYLSQDLGRTWSAPIGRDFQALAETGGRLYAAVGYGTYQYSEDHGAQWMSLPQPAGNIRLTAFLAAHDGWLYSGSDYVYRRPATKESLPWEVCPVLKPAPLPTGTANYFIRFIPAGPLVFAGSWDGRWQYSADSGASWKLVDSILQAAKLRALAHGTAWVAATPHGVFRSPDGEGDWTKVNTGLDDSTFSVLRHGTAFFVGGSKGRIAYSLDQGLTWKSLDPVPGLDTVAALAVQEGSLAVISPYHGIWSTPLPEGIVSVRAAPHSREAEAGLQLRSGVMKPGDAVALVLGEPAAVRLSLHAADGKRVAVLRTGRMGAGWHEVSLDPARLRGLPRGRYLLELRAGNRRWSAGLFLDR